MYETSASAANTKQVSDRRVHPRLTLRSLLYTELSDNNGGVILDLSEGGFKILAVDALVGDAFPRIRFRFNQSEEWIQAAGKIVWRGPSKKEAGIQFLNLPEEVRAQIRTWISSQIPFPPVPSEKENVGPIPEAGGSNAEACKPQGQGFDDVLDELDNFFPAEPQPPTPAWCSAGSSSFDDFFPAESTLPPRRPEPAGSSGSATVQNPSLPDVGPEIAPLVRAVSVFADSIKPEPEIPASAAPINAVPSARSGMREQPPDSSSAPPARNLFDSPSEATPAPPNAMELWPAGLAPEPIVAPDAPQHASPAQSAPDLSPVAMSAVRAKERTVTEVATQEQAPARSALVEAFRASQLSSQRAYLSSYAASAPLSAPSHTSWFVTAIVSFAAGLGFTALLLFGPLDLTRLRLFLPAQHGMQNVATAVPEQAPPPQAPGAPDLSTQQLNDARTSDSPSALPPSPPVKHEPAIARNSSPATVPSISVRKNHESSARQARSDQALSGPQPQSSPIAPSVQEEPGKPIGYVASNSRFIALHFTPAQPGWQPFRPSGDLHIGQLISSHQPVYSDDALRNRVEGVVKLRAIVSRDGMVEKVEPVSGPPALLPAAINAVQDWRYEPTTVGGIPAESEQDIVMVFRLSSS